MAKRQVVLVVLGVAVALSLGGAGGSAFPEPAAQARPTVVTLVTGDQVTLDYAPDGRPIVAVEPVDRRAGTGFQTLNVGGHLYVIPVAAAGYLGAPLDPSLFDVTALAARDQSAPLALDVVASDPAVTLPGITLTSPANGTESRSEAARFGRALAADWWAKRQGNPGKGLFAGIERIALAGATPSATAGSLLPAGQPAGKLYTLTIKGFDRNGQKAFGNIGVVYNVDDGNTFIAGQSFFNGTFSYSVPAGTYQVSALITSGATPEDTSFTFTTAPEVTVRSNNAVVVLDARKSSRVDATVPDPTSPIVEQMTLQRDPAQGPNFSSSFTAFGPTAMYATPTRAVTVGQQYFYSSFRLGDATGGLDRYLYDLQLNYVGAIPNDLSPTLGRNDLATVDATYHSSTPARNELEWRLALAPWQSGAGGVPTRLTAPSARTEYVLPQPDTLWVQTVVADEQEFAGWSNGLWSAPAAGSRQQVAWHTQPEGPGVEQQTLVGQSCPVCRAGDTLGIALLPYVDAGGHTTLPDPGISSELTLYRDGTLVDEQPSGFAQFALAPEPAHYQLAFDVSRDAPWWPTSTRSHTVWTFDSAERAPDTLPAGWTCGGKGGGGGKGDATDGKGGDGGGGDDGCSFEPLLFASYDTHAGADDVVPAGQNAVIDVTVAHQPHAPAAPVDSLALDVSFDDGASWTPAPVTALGGGRFRAAYAQPAVAETTGFASLRITASDAGGSMLEQTIVRAYPLAVPAPADGGGGGRGAPPFRPCNTAVVAPYAECMAIVAPAGRGDPPPPPPQGYGAADIASAYRLPAGAGAGKTVAIVDAYDNPNAESDLAVYRDANGLPPCTTANGCFRKVNQHGVTGPLPLPDPGWGLEISLDLDAVSATCPSCNILLVEADSPSIFDLGPAVDTAVALGADAVSNSYGSRGEFSGETLFERYYKHAGVAITVSSGDYGYGNGLLLTGGVSYPGSSEFVTSVGGTTLVRDDSARGWTETAWAGSTSGCSAYIHKPGWQKDNLCGKRSVADVAAVADPQTGLAVYDTFGYDGWLTVGGTSLSSPIVASVYAMAGATSTLRYGVGPYRAGTGLFDVVGGSNGLCGGSYLCTGVEGYDGPTGLGTPDGLDAFR
ncbi:MAG: S8 family serine peptidase [Gaiellaceae bacterium]